MRPVFSLLVLGAIAYVAGLFVFAAEVNAPAPPLSRADAIVVLTGGELRVDRAAALLEKGYGKRLLITGVDLSATKADIKRLVHDGSKFDCCADLGFVAADTRGNAEETADWAAAHGYRKLIVVTANYHMPRTLTEFTAAMPGIAFEPYPVTPEDIDFAHWWRRPRTLKLLHGEYVKFLASATLNHVVRPLFRRLTEGEK